MIDEWEKCETGLSRWGDQYWYKITEYEVVKAEWVAVKTEMDGMSTRLGIFKERYVFCRGRRPL